MKDNNGELFTVLAKKDVNVGFNNDNFVDIYFVSNKRANNIHYKKKIRALKMLQKYQWCFRVISVEFEIENR